MHVNARENGDPLELVDAQNRILGQIAIERADAELVCGSFAPSPSFAAVETLFRDYEEAVNVQSLAAVDELDAQIARLGLSVVLRTGPRINISDVQIWSDGAISFRPVGQGASLVQASATT